jgi:hypothetical protein
MQDLKRAAKLAVLGASGFWLPDAVVHGLRGHKFNDRDVFIVSAVMPLTFLLTYMFAKKLTRDARGTWGRS